MKIGLTQDSVRTSPAADAEKQSPSSTKKNIIAITGRFPIEGKISTFQRGIFATVRKVVTIATRK